MNLAEWAPLVAPPAIGYVWQQLRARKNIPNIVSAAICVAVGVAVYLLSYTGPIVWTRQFVVGAVMWTVGLRGFASISSDLGMAPPTNSVGGAPPADPK